MSATACIRSMPGFYLFTVFSVNVFLFCRSFYFDENIVIASMKIATRSAVEKEQQDNMKFLLRDWSRLTCVMILAC